MFLFSELISKNKRPIVMGILNITPDSFMDGGESYCLSNALERLISLQEQGADIIDIGACSTAPGNELASCEEEIRRLKLFLPSLIKEANVPVSVDTFRSDAAEYALSVGASVINDESGIFDSSMAQCIKNYGAGWIVMHTGGGSSEKTVEYKNGVVDDVTGFFNLMQEKAILYSIEKNQLAFDVGIGFGKTREDELQLLNSLSSFDNYHPLLVGVSGKRVVGEATGRDKSNRLFGSIAAGTVAVYNGADILRVHNVSETLDAVKMVWSIKKEKI